MPPDGEERRGFFRGFAQSPVTYTLACVLLLAGIGLFVWDIRIPAGATWLRWRPWAGLVLGGVAIFSLNRIGAWPDKPRSEVERWQRRRRGWLANAMVFMAYAVLMPLITWKVWNTSLRAGDLTGPALPGGLVAVPLVVAGLMFRRYQRAGRKLRGLQGRCEECGYDLRSLPEARCPECGTPFTPRNTAQ